MKSRIVKYGIVVAIVISLLVCGYWLWNYVTTPLGNNQPYSQSVNSVLLDNSQRTTQINCVKLCDDWTPGIGQVAHIKRVPQHTAKYTVYEPYEKLMNQLQQQVDNNNQPQQTTFASQELSSGDIIINNVQPWTPIDTVPQYNNRYSNNDWYAPVLYRGGWSHDHIVIENITNNIITNCDTCCVSNSQPPSVVPEPPAAILIVVGLIGILLIRRKR